MHAGVRIHANSVQRHHKSRLGEVAEEFVLYEILPVNYIDNPELTREGQPSATVVRSFCLFHRLSPTISLLVLLLFHLSLFCV